LPSLAANQITRIYFDLYSSFISSAFNGCVNKRYNQQDFSASRITNGKSTTVMDTDKVILQDHIQKFPSCEMRRRKYWYTCIVTNVSNKLVVSSFKADQEDCLEERGRPFFEHSVTYIPTYTATCLIKWKSSSKMLEEHPI
jgi:hypothetical protein